ncbi:MAG: TVP38/TMEM64 family protein [Nitrospirota bacterium]|nr:TVP38/TMEM64 family protein [Nitrospirota bacterium]
MPLHEDRRVSRLKLTAVLLLLVVTLLISTRLDVGAFFAPDRIVPWLQEAGAFAPVGFIAVMALSVVVSPIPSLPLDILAGRVFGPLAGTLYAVAGGALGAVVSFQIARLLGRDIIARFLEGHIHFCQKCSDKLLTKVVFFSRLVPFVSFDLVSYGAGFTRMSLWKFSLATFVGMLPLTFFYAAYGAVILENSVATWVGGLVMVALFFVVPPWIERYDFLGLKRYFQHGPDERA